MGFISYKNENIGEYDTLIKVYKAFLRDELSLGEYKIECERILRENS